MVGTEKIVPAHLIGIFFLNEDHPFQVFYFNSFLASEIRIQQMI